MKALGRGRIFLSAALIASAALFAGFQAESPNPLDDFEDVSAWQAAPAPGVSAALSRAEGLHGGALRLDYDFAGHAGWAAARRRLPVELEGNWEISFAIRGEGLANDLEVKLVDASGENVWWSVRRGFVPPARWTVVRLKKRHFSFAWGPASDRTLRGFASFEVAVTASAGGRGWIALDDLALTALPPPGPAARPPLVSASSFEAGFEPARAMDGSPDTSWRSAGSGAEWIAADFGERREYGGLTVRWEPGRFARQYAVETSDDGSAWTPVREVRAGSGGRDDIFLPESESRFVRLRLERPGGSDGYGIREIAVQPLSWSETPNAFFEAIARDSPRGTFPRGLSGEQTYWTVVGVSGDTDCALFSEDGAVEPSRGAVSLEPFVFANGRLFSWSDVRTEHALEDGDLPIPRVVWRIGALSLEATALASGSPGDSAVEVRYRVVNGGREPRRARLFLAVRPFQVNPPTQFLNGAGGAVSIRSLAWDGRAVAVDGVPRVIPEDPPAGFGAVPFETGPVPEFLAAGRLPSSSRADDGFGYASGALAWDVDLAAGASRDFVVALPIHPASAAAVPSGGAAGFARRLAERKRAWRSVLDAVELTGPPEAEELFRTLRSNLAWMLVERDGPALRPGTRSYARSWIRDGAMMSAALLRLGRSDAARAYVEWFAPHQDPDGRVPCCVDRRGADPVVENDSHGELLFAIAECFRFTGDRAFLEALFPHVEAAVSWIDALRAQRRTDEYRAPGKLAFFGLLPESISHEGYSARPVHSYWDDFWALRGLKDAAEMARALGRDALAAKWSADADELEHDLLASIERVIATRGIDFVPGSADLADFDATSTTIALDPGGELARLPRPALTRTFERYWSEFVRRRDSNAWEDYTPYELRNVGAFVRLGWRDRAQELLRWFLKDRRPPAWNGWAEAVGRELRKPRFVGDIPHAWVGSDFIRSVLDLFAWERESDGALVLASGVPAGWLDGGREVGIRNLQTRWGPLAFSMRRGPKGLRMRVSGGIRMPPGGVVLAPPLPADAHRATVDGKSASLSGGELVLRRVPAEVVFR